MASLERSRINSALKTPHKYLALFIGLICGATLLVFLSQQKSSSSKREVLSDSTKNRSVSEGAQIKNSRLAMISDEARRNRLIESEVEEELNIFRLTMEPVEEARAQLESAYPGASSVVDDQQEIDPYEEGRSVVEIAPYRHLKNEYRRALEESAKAKEIFQQAKAQAERRLDKNSK